MTNAEYYKTKEAAEKAYIRIGIVKKLFETSYTQGFVNWLYEKHVDGTDKGCTLIYLVYGHCGKPERYSTYLENVDIDDGETYFNLKIVPVHSPYKVKLLFKVKGKYMDYDYDPVPMKDGDAVHYSDADESFSLETMLKKIYHQQKLTNDILSGNIRNFGHACDAIKRN